MNPNKFLIGISIALLITMGRFAYMLPSVSRGEDAPSIQSTLLNGESFDLKDLRGKYVLVDFWDSWCGPCLKELPHVIDLYKEYKDAEFKDANGLVLINVAIERDEKRWKNAINRIGMPWKYHLVDLTTSFKFINAPIAQEFGVKQVPSKFLLDEHGVIIGVNQSVEELDEFLSERLR